MRILLKNGKIIAPMRTINKGGVLIDNGKIETIFEDYKNIEPGKNVKTIDVQGNYISPGFIEIHTHGAGGYDFMDGDVQSILGACQKHMEFGVTSIVPTTLTSTMEELFHMLDNFKRAKRENKKGPNILGLHLEGPYFSVDQKGAQDARYIKEPDPSEYKKILDYSDEIIRWTIAPELKGALKMGEELTRRGILGCIGHSNAVYEEVLKAYEHGFTHLTHFYSGMSMVRRIDAYRYAGVVESGYLIDEMTVEIIADGKHLPASLLKLIIKVKGPDRTCLVSDSMRAAGMPEGEYILGSKKDGQRVIVEKGVAKLLDRSAFAGSVATADRLIRTMINLADLSIGDAIKMMTLTPARILGIDGNKGSISSGKDADLVVFDKEINVLIVIVNGKIELSTGQLY